MYHRRGGQLCTGAALNKCASRVNLNATLTEYNFSADHTNPDICQLSFLVCHSTSNKGEGHVVYGSAN